MNGNNMKVVILAGGYGTRIADVSSDLIPKPMIPIGNKPIIWHIMNIFARFGYNDFVIALGYKSKIIREYFNNNIIENKESKWKIRLINTGLDSLTGTRLYKLRKHLSNERFFLTYGDGLSNININKLLNFHIKNKKKITMSAVRPPARFGEIYFKKNNVISFEEKPQIQNGWINGGFFVVEPGFLKFLNSKKNEMLERDPLKKAIKGNELTAYKHNSFWQCMDTKRDYDYLNLLWKQKKYLWIK